MKYITVYDKPTRLRVRCAAYTFTKSHVEGLIVYFKNIKGVFSVSINHLNNSILFCNFVVFLKKFDWLPLATGV